MPPNPAISGNSDNDRTSQGGEDERKSSQEVKIEARKSTESPDITGNRTPKIVKAAGKLQKTVNSTNYTERKQEDRKVQEMKNRTAGKVTKILIAKKQDECQDMAKKTEVKFKFEPGNSEVIGSNRKSRCQKVKQDKGILKPQEYDKKPVSNLRLRLKQGNQK